MLSKIFIKVPHQGSRSIELDFLRGIAILMVMSLHNHTPSDRPILPFGGTGVDLFFVLSGFLVGGLLMKEYKRTEGLDAKRFIFRRGMKIWPSYYVFILLEVVFSLLDRKHTHPLSSFLWQNLLHVQNYAHGSISHTWSLAVEEHFYLALALGMGWMVARKWPPERMLKVFGAAMVLVLISRLVTFLLVGINGGWFEYTHNRLDAMACGVSLALLFHFFPEKFARLAKPKWVLAATVAVVVVFLATINAENLAIQRTIGFTITYVGAAALLLLVYTHSGRWSQTWPYRAVAAMGVYSYGIYLYHNSVHEPSVKLASHFHGVLHWPVMIALDYGLAILAGAFMTRIVEWPFLLYRDRIIPQKVADIGSIELQSEDVASSSAEHLLTEAQ